MNDEKPVIQEMEVSCGLEDDSFLVEVHGVSPDQSPVTLRAPRHITGNDLIQQVSIWESVTGVVTFPLPHYLPNKQSCRGRLL